MNRAATAMPETPAQIGPLLRDWRQRRRLSQLDLALEADISTRHLSFLENGRARPSRDMLLHLAELMQVPLRERNALLVAAGFAPMFGERRLDDPQLTQARAALELLLKAHEPYPALVVDRHWNLQTANAAAQRLLSVLPASALQPPLNVLRLSLDPNGMAPLILNLGEWRQHLLARLRMQVHASGDAELLALLQELSAYPPLPGEQVGSNSTPRADVVVLFRLRLPQGELALFSTITVFGTPTDITLSELALEAFYPADPASAALLQRLADAT
ncbi:helix-turn-helix domain-containing protein [Pseudomarimonas arenosa]|uniref:Helix-turn-helix transcriptional regulator n=1 Tax=Pseudomarimonas arenosa TaxID=2774145 RepID=A0AAW3ZT36_9GAMM|nr:helix-turn-helix transcriptional regulator [Pseudomarimonas arenosa]MBD8527346.1 helix-turn-helix transcriptional regulator [Pseudomarimonas arenosa]